MPKVLRGLTHRALVDGVSCRGRTQFLPANPEVKPIVNKFGTERGVFGDGFSSTDVKGVPGNFIPDLVVPLIFCLGKLSMTVKSNFVAENGDVVRRDDLVAVGDFHRKVAWSEWTAERHLCIVLRTLLALKLSCRHFVAEHI